MSRSLIQKRRQARFLLVQALYQWQLSENAVADVLQQFQLGPQFQRADQSYFSDHFLAITKQTEALDGLYQPHLDRALAEIDPVEMNILRLATYELAHCPELPYRVVINEAMELAKIFGAAGSHKYINGVLDKVAKQLRSVEMK